MFNRIKYTEGKKCIDHVILLGISAAVTQKLLEQSRVWVEWLGILVFDFELFIGVQRTCPVSASA